MTGIYVRVGDNTSFPASMPKSAILSVNLQPVSYTHLDAKVKAEVNFSILPKIFPLEEGVTMKGSLSAALRTHVLLVDIMNKNFGKLDIRGGCRLRDVLLASEMCIRDRIC